MIAVFSCLFLLVGIGLGYVAAVRWPAEKPEQPKSYPLEDPDEKLDEDVAGSVPLDSDVEWLRNWSGPPEP